MKKMLCMLSLLTAVCASTAAVSYADNPVIKDVFTGDPAALVHGDKVYLYTGHDEAAPGGTFFVMKDWLIFSSDDMVNWKPEGSLPLSTFSWAAPNSAWASQVIERDGSFYWYVTVLNNDGTGYAIGVAKSDRPTSGFVDVLGKPLVSSGMTQAPASMGSVPWDDIDPTVLIDKDGQAYLYWGNSHCYYAKLKPNMTELDGEIHRVTINNLQGTFTEAPWIHEHQGKYYLSFARNYPEELAYAMSDSPAGPWEYKGTLLDPLTKDTADRTASNTSHQSIIEFKGSSYLIYHNSSLPTGGQYRRSTAIDRLQYNADGTIRKVIPTSTGIDGTSYRLQPLDSPDRYIRNYKGEIRLDPAEGLAYDARWQIVQGLAGAPDDDAFISLQSEEFPGYYLRQLNGSVGLAKHDGTQAFTESATFKKVPGLAESSAYSLQSYSSPEHYLLHSGPRLTVGPASGADAERRASFRFLEAAVSNIVLDKTALDMMNQSTSRLTAEAVPGSALNRAVRFTSSNPAAAAVSDVRYDAAAGKTSATITALSPGTAVITAVSDEGRVQAETTVTVKETIGGVAISSDHSKQIRIEGILSQVRGRDVTLKVTAPDGSTDFLDQTVSAENGAFSFGYRLKNAKPGVYQVQLGAVSLAQPVQTSFEYKGGVQDGGGSPDDSGSGGGDSGSPDSGDSDNGSSSGPVTAPATPPAAPSPAPAQPSPAAGGSGAADFQDVGEAHAWAQDAIRALASRGIIQGTSSSTFEPARPISRADFITLLVRAFGLKAGTEAPAAFDDVTADAYYAEAVSIFQSLGLTDGVDGNRFAPQDEISRQDMMVLVARVLQHTQQLKIEAAAAGTLDRFADQPLVSPYAADSAAALVEQGYIEGSGDRLNPQGPATRAETAVMLHRILNKMSGSDHSAK